MSGAGFIPRAEGVRSRIDTPYEIAEREKEAARRELYEGFDSLEELEENRLYRLQLANEELRHADITHGGQYIDPTFDPTYGGTGGSGLYARPPTGWDYEHDTPKIEYFEMFGEPSLAEKAEFEEEYSRVVGADVWSPAELIQLENLRDEFYGGERSPFSTFNRLMYSDFNIDNREETLATLDEAGIEEYLKPTTLEEAKLAADNAYIEYLEENYTNENRITAFKAIEKGPLNFDTVEDIELYHSLPDDDIQKKAMDIQGVVMEDFLRNQAGATDSQNLTQGKSFSWGWGGKAGYTQLNTGTIIGTPDINMDNYTIGSFGEYGNSSYNDEPSDTAMDNLNIAFDVVSVMYPPLAPVFQGIKATINTGDIEEGFKSAAKTYALKEIGSSAADFAVDVFKDLNINIDTFELPQPAKEILGNTIGGIASGESGEEALKGAITKQVGSVVVEGLDIDEDAVIGKIKTTLGMDADADVPEFVKNIATDTATALVEGESVSDAFDSSVKSEAKDFVGEVAEQGVKLVANEAGDIFVSAAELAGDVFEDTVDALGPVGDIIETGLNVGSDILSEVEDVVIEPIKTVAPIVEDIVIDPIKEAVEPAIDIAKDVGQDVIDLGSDVLSEVEDIVIEPIKTVAPIVEDIVIDPIKEIPIDILNELRTRVGLPPIVTDVIETVGDIGQGVIDVGSDVLSEVEDIVIDPIKTVAPVVEDIVIDPIKTVAPVVEDIVIDPIKTVAPVVEDIVIDPIKTGIETVVDIADEGLDVFGEKVIDPALQAGKELGQDVIDLGSDVLSEAEDIFIEPVKEVVDALPSVDLPDIDLPDVDLPDVDLSLPSFDYSMLTGLTTPRQPTQVEGLFDKELFKFDTEIKSTQEMLSPFMNSRKYG
jgi:hypothetical protein